MKLFKYLFASMLFTATEFCYADHITWNLDGSQFNGNGCTKNVDAFVAANGDDLAIVFTNLGIELPGGNPKKSDSKNCHFKVPAQVTPGHFIGDLTQSLTYGITKSANARGGFRWESNFFGFSMKAHVVETQYGQSMNEPLLETHRTDHYRKDDDWGKRWCHPNRPRQGALNADLKVFGQKIDKSDGLIMAIDGMDLKIEMKSGVTDCNSLHPPGHSHVR